jgi:hypothetical protein
MKHVSPLLIACPALAAALWICACSKSQEAPDAGASAPSSGPSSSPGSADWLLRRASAHPDPSARPVPSFAPMPVPGRPPDWDLDTDDPARDYVRRYVFSTKRYGDTLDCVELIASQPAGDKRRVEVKTAAACPGAGTQRDVFLVDLAGDRLAVDDKSKRDPLTRWPDGSSADGPPGEIIREITRMNDWKSPLKDVLIKHRLSPIRLQSYGRGSYPVVSLAGWYDIVQLDAPQDVLRPFAEEICRVTGGMPMGILAAADRTRLLRVRCPAATFWDKL